MRPGGGDLLDGRALRGPGRCHASGSRGGFDRYYARGRQLLRPGWPVRPSRVRPLVSPVLPSSLRGDHRGGRGGCVRLRFRRFLFSAAGAAGASSAAATAVTTAGGGERRQLLGAGGNAFHASAGAWRRCCGYDRAVRRCGLRPLVRFAAFPGARRRGRFFALLAVCVEFSVVGHEVRGLMAFARSGFGAFRRARRVRHRFPSRWPSRRPRHRHGG